MKKNISKFKDIAFPFFALRHRPYKVLYDLNKIYIVRHENSHKETLDDKNLSGDYFARLLQLENRVIFDYTCKNIQELVYLLPKWGVDSKARPFDLTKKEPVSVKVKKVKKVSNNLVWIDSIAYPFRLNTKERLDITESTYVTLININNEWFIKEFTMDPAVINKTIYI